MLEDTLAQDIKSNLFLCICALYLGWSEKKKNKSLNGSRERFRKFRKILSSTVYLPWTDAYSEEGKASARENIAILTYYQLVCKK